MVVQSGAVVAEREDCSQQIVIAPAALAHLAKHRQLRWFSSEAGGQLFGTVTAEEVVVSRATGPYRGDKRGRYSYRSNPKAAQAAIKENAAAGLMYLGEWHTHPEHTPTASPSDLATMDLLHERSTLRLSSVILLIQGTDRLTIYDVGAEGATRWGIEANS